MAEIDDHVAENYDSIVADEVRNVSYEDIAKHAEEMNDANLAAWARERAGAKAPKNARAAKQETRKA
ncbi:hypothetical protein ACFRFH_12110 [Leifsonia sp. NPDC056824]|uniref:hypothetical protein n=1 Tax=Leifsonia sp. NPDC056824 TaxID=3345953 RepID=UPI0036A8FB06